MSVFSHNPGEICDERGGKKTCQNQRELCEMMIGKERKYTEMAIRFDQWKEYVHWVWEENGEN